jgi:hypothetical protein
MIFYYPHGEKVMEKDVITFESERGNRITGVVEKKDGELMVNTGDLYLVDLFQSDHMRCLGKIK